MRYPMKDFEEHAIREAASRLNDDQPNSRGVTYRMTNRGQVDVEMYYAARVLKTIWRQTCEPISVRQFEREMNAKVNNRSDADLEIERQWLPQALAKMNRLNLIKFSQQNRFIGKGDDWIA